MKKTKSKKTKLNDVMNVIGKWCKDNNNEVCFYGGFVSFDANKIEAGDDDIIKEDRIICYGDKTTIKISLDDFVKEFNKEKEEFINW